MIISKPKLFHVTLWIKNIFMGYHYIKLQTFLISYKIPLSQDSRPLHCTFFLHLTPATPACVITVFWKILSSYDWLLIFWDSE
jgi:hypothetical protein